MSEVVRQTFDTFAASAASKTTYAGAGMTLGGWWTSNEFLGLAGLMIAMFGFAVNWYYKHKLTMAEIRVLEAKEARDAEEHNARMGMY